MKKPEKKAFKKTTSSNSNNDYHFRHHFKKEKNINKKDHPALIVKDNKDTMDYLKVTHSPKKDKNRLNHKLEKNPNPIDKKPAFIEKGKIRKDNKDMFGKKLNNWNLTNNDKKMVNEIVMKKTNNKKK